MATPNLSRDTFDESKDYVRVIFQQTKPVLDAELNELQAIVGDIREKSFFAALVNGPLADSFGFTLDEENPSDFQIGGGVFLYYGKFIRVKTPENFSLPFPTGWPEDWLVYLESSLEYVSEVEDPDIVDPSLGLVTTYRLKREAELKIKLGTQVPVVDQDHVIIPLWKVTRRPAVAAIDLDDVEDWRHKSTVNYVLSGGIVSVTSGLTVAWSDIDLIQWNQNKTYEAGTIILPANSTRILYLSENMILLSEEFPRLNGGRIPLAKIVTGASSVSAVEDLRPLWNPADWPDWEDAYCRQVYPFQKGMSLSNGTIIIPKNLIRDLRIWNGNLFGTYYISRVAGAKGASTFEIDISNTATSLQISLEFSIPSEVPSDGLIRATGWNGESGESSRIILDVNAIENMFASTVWQEANFTVDTTTICYTNVAVAWMGSGFGSSVLGSGGISGLINNWRATNLVRDYPIWGTSDWLRDHMWDFVLNGARSGEVYYISRVVLNHPDGNFIEVSAQDLFDATTRVVLRLERQGITDAYLQETWVTSLTQSIWGEVATANANFSDVEDPTYKCFSLEEGRIYPARLVPAMTYDALCMGDNCIDVFIEGTSTGFGGTQAPIPILIDSNCYPDMVVVSFAEVCWCWPWCDEYYPYWGYHNWEDCVELCPGARDCGIWYLEYRQVGRNTRIVRIMYGYVGRVCEGEGFRLRIEAEEVCGDKCFEFSYYLSSPETTIQSQLWLFGDGHSSTEAKPTHGYDVSGTYTVTLTVTLDDSTILTETIQIVA